MKITYIHHSSFLVELESVYLLFDYIRCQFTGKFVYGFAEPDVLTFPYAVLIGIAVYIIMMLFSFCLLKVNKVIHR